MTHIIVPARKSKSKGQLFRLLAIDLNKPWRPSKRYLARLELAKRLEIAARNMQRRPGRHHVGRIKHRGERLTIPILWTGRQWAVTPSGVECRDGCYYIAKDRLWENNRAAWGGWVRHMSAKQWVDLRDFAEALRVARMIHDRADAATQRSVA